MLKNNQRSAERRVRGWRTANQEVELRRPHAAEKTIIRFRVVIETGWANATEGDRRTLAHAIALGICEYPDKLAIHASLGIGISPYRP